MVLVTTKNSNILEDLETLRLFAKVVPEFCQVMTESEVAANAFELIFAFDEIIALGYREQVNLSQIRTYTEMESHDENIYKMVQKVRATFASTPCHCSLVSRRIKSGKPRST